MEVRTWNGGGIEWNGSANAVVVRPRRRKRPSLYDDVVAGRVSRDNEDAMKRSSVSSVAGLLPAKATRKLELAKKRGESDFGIMLTGDRPAIFTNISHRSAASRAGLRVGDVLLEVNGRSVEGENHSDIVGSIAKCKKTVTFAVVDDETYRIGMSLAGFSAANDAPSASPPMPASSLMPRNEDASPARSVSAASSLASRSSLASQSDNDSGKSPTTTTCSGGAVSSSPTMSMQSSLSQVSQDSTTGTTSPPTSLRTFLDTEETRYDGKRRSSSHQSVTWDQRSRLTTMSGRQSATSRSALAKSKSFSQSDGSITRSGRPGSAKNNVAFTLTEDVVVGPPTETHRVAGGSLVQHYDFDVLYYGNVPLSKVTTQCQEPNALTELAAEAVQAVGEETAVKVARMQVSSSGLCLIERTDEKDPKHQVDPAFIPRAHLSAAWCSRQSPFRIALLQRSNLWSIPPSSPLHQQIMHQQSTLSDNGTSSSRRSPTASSSSSSSSPFSDTAVTTATSCRAGSSQETDGNTTTAPSRHVLVVNAHVVEIIDSSSRTSHHSSRGASPKATRGNVHFPNGQQQQQKVNTPPQLHSQAQGIVTLLSTLFQGSQAPPPPEAAGAAALSGVQPSGPTAQSSLPTAALHSLQHETSEKADARLGPGRGPDSSEPLNLVDAQGSVSFLGLRNLTSRPSLDGGSKSAIEAAIDRHDTELNREANRLHPAVTFDWRSAHQITSTSSTSSSSVGARQEDEQLKRNSEEDVHDLTLTQDLADEKFAALNLSSSTAAGRAAASRKAEKISMESLRPGTAHSQRVSKWAANIKNLLEDEDGCALFKEFLKGLFASENLEFWQQVQDFQTLTDEKEIKEEAKRIYNLFIDKDSPTQVNLTDQCYQETAEDLHSNPNPDMFELAEREIFVLMRTDSYPKFLRSPVFQEWMTLEVSGDPLPCDTAAEKKAKASQKKKRLGGFISGKSKKSSKPESSGSREAEDAYSTSSKPDVSSKWLQPEKVNPSRSEGKLNRTPKNSPQHSALQPHNLSPAGSEKSLAISMTSSPSISKKDRHAQKSGKKYSFFHKKDKQPEIQVNLPSGGYIFEDPDPGLEDMKDDEILLKVTFTEHSCGTVRRKKSTSIREAIEPICERAGYSCKCVVVYEQVQSIEREVDMALQVGSLQGSQIRIVLLPCIKLHLPDNSFEFLVVPDGNKKSISGLVDHYLNRFGLSYIDDGVTATNLSGERVHPFANPLSYVNSTLVLNFDAGLMTTRARRLSGDSAVSAASASSVQSVSPVKSPARVRSSSFRKASPFSRKSSRASPSGSPAPSRGNRYSQFSDEGDLSSQRTSSPGRSSVSTLRKEMVESPVKPPVSPDSQNALFDLVEKAQCDSMDNQRATLQLPAAGGAPSYGPGFTPPLSESDPAAFQFDSTAAGSNGGLAPRAAVGEILKNRLPAQMSADELLVTRRMSASPQTYRHRIEASGSRGSTSSLNLSKLSVELHASVESLPSSLNRSSGSRRLLKSLSRSLSKLSGSTSDMQLNPSVLASMLKDGERAETPYTPGEASDQDRTQDTLSAASPELGNAQGYTAAKDGVTALPSSSGLRHEAASHSVVSLPILPGSRHQAGERGRARVGSVNSKSSSSKLKLNSSSESSSDEDDMSNKPRTGKRMRVDEV